MSSLQIILTGHCLDFALEWELTEVKTDKRDAKTLEKIVKQA
jgi:hypothetical protein